jgi:hypothetical protein
MQSHLLLQQEMRMLLERLHVGSRRLAARIEAAALLQLMLEPL